MINSSSRLKAFEVSVGGLTMISIIEGRPEIVHNLLNSSTSFARESGDSSLRHKTRNFNPTLPMSRMRIGSTSRSIAVSVAAPPAGPTNKSAAAISPQLPLSAF